MEGQGSDGSRERKKKGGARQKEREIQVKQLCLSQTEAHRVQRRAPHFPNTAPQTELLASGTPRVHLGIPEMMSKPQEAGFRWGRGNRGEPLQRAAPGNPASTKKASARPWGQSKKGLTGWAQPSHAPRLSQVFGGLHSALRWPRKGPQVLGSSEVWLGRLLWDMSPGERGLCTWRPFSGMERALDTVPADRLSSQRANPLRLCWGKGMERVREGGV